LAKMNVSTNLPFTADTFTVKNIYLHGKKQIKRLKNYVEIKNHAYGVVY
ncbi:34756_t:CDS:1, partial [Gigaspora margarita]